MQAESTLPTYSGGRPRQYQMTLLAEAICSRKVDVVRKVLEYRVDMTPPAGENSLLFFALRVPGEDTPAIVESLVKAGANVNEHDGFLHQTPLFDAYTAPGAVKVLLAAGANIEARDDDGQTPLIRGAMVEPMVRELLADGADPRAVAKNGDTALKVSEKYSCVACASLIGASLKLRTILQSFSDKQQDHSHCDRFNIVA
jgi:ankyrin repeat protein